ncbi:hypothetical protein PPM_0723 [Paenibacillus polymyxa M1]|nr:hypothetical protein PPM_0723 [Paenibacillus polymyxa M1]
MSWLGHAIPYNKRSYEVGIIVGSFHFSYEKKLNISL